MGSPPPMRGKVKLKIYEGKNVGITPAYAGKSRYRLYFKLSRWDHPRLCGEKCIGKSWIFCRLGSPPPMRGKAHDYMTIYTVIRITPAYAGKRSLILYAISSKEDHPRLCGEKVKLSAQLVYDAGSPPPMRGKGSCTEDLEFQRRITPAYAGKRRMGYKKH